LNGHGTDYTLKKNKEAIMKKPNAKMIIAVILLNTTIGIQLALAQSRVVIPGTFQSGLGCPGDWMPDCSSTELTYNPYFGAWMGTFEIPAGCHQYKVAIDGSWNENYGQNGIRDGQNIILGLGETTMVTFVYYHFSHWVYTYPVSSGASPFCAPQQAHIAGSFQSQVGCPGDWMPNCDLTEMTYNPQTARFEKELLVPQGCWEFKITTNGSWDVNYGLWGTLGGPNITISLPEGDDHVFFTYNPATNWITASRQTMVCEPNVVVLGGTFQNELGCSEDWMADCDATRMEYSKEDTSWKITLLLPAGNWEYKFAINNSWDENYGMGGDFDGANYQLELCYPAEVTFWYGHSTRWSFNSVHSNGICLTKFYDNNANDKKDAGEQAMEGISFTLNGMGINQTKTTDSEGKISFGDLPNGEYMITENVPQHYVTTGENGKHVFINNGMVQVAFGNVCLGSGGVNGLGYWITKQGENALNAAGIMQMALWRLRWLNLRKGNGDPFDPYNYEEFRVWLKGANAQNMMYMVSAQMAISFLNNLVVNPENKDRYIYTENCEILYSKFMSIEYLIDVTNYFLEWISDATGNYPYRKEFECLKDLLEKSNNNLNWVQEKPCPTGGTIVKKQAGSISDIEKYEVKIWPNPSFQSFTLRPGIHKENKTVHIRVLDLSGRTIFATHGNSMKDYRFGDNFHPGIYVVEVNEGGKVSTHKIMKK
jgi:hypothetical protein